MTLRLGTRISFPSRPYGGFRRHGPEPDTPFHCFVLVLRVLASVVFIGICMHTTSTGSVTTFASWIETLDRNSSWEVWKNPAFIQDRGLTATEWVEYVIRFRALSFLFFFNLSFYGDWPSRGQIGLAPPKNGQIPVVCSLPILCTGRHGGRQRRLIRVAASGML